MKKIITFLIALALGMSCMAVTGCGPKADFKIGIVQLVDHVALDAANKGFREELEALLKKEGKTVEFINKSASGDFGNCTTIANTFVAKKVDLMLAIATPAAQAAASVTTEIPILFTAVTNPVVAGLTESWDEPKTNVSGTSDLNPVEDQIDLIRELVPGVKKIAVFYDLDEPNSLYQLELVEDYCEKLDITVVKKGIPDINDLQQSYNSLDNDVQAIYIPTDNTLANGADQVHALNKDGKQLPIVCGETGMNDKCGVATYGIDYYKLGKQTAKMAFKILIEGADIAKMPVETAEGEPELSINQTVADEIDFTIPDSVLNKVNQA
ncbi:MAG: ABC transporter substrate-binding protein [Clostridiales bacterium]|nr:ABC transporter substrate-binding protein [Clostridiales bacterium]